MEKMQYEEQIRLLGQGEPGEILDKLLKISQDSLVGLQFFSYYKEVPISSLGEVLYLFGDSLICRTNPAQTRAIRQSRYVILRSDRLEHDVYANASYNSDSNELSLSEFAFVELMPDRRNSIRVRVAGLFPVTVEAGTEQFKAKLKDLSLGGCAIEIPDRLLLGSFSYFNINFSFDLKNRSEPQKIRVMSRLLRIENEGNPPRCIFLFEHDNRSEDLVGMYVGQRQAEIIRELKVAT